MILSWASYAWAAPPEGALGASLARPAGAAGATGSLGGDAPSFDPAAGRRAGRYAGALGALQPEGRATTRGANETRVYREASPSVVLIVSEDSLGSGALISADGKIVTNLHVVGDAEEVGVIFKPALEGAAIGKADVRRAKVLRRDEVADLALIQVAEVPAGVKPLVLGSAADVQVGSDVHAIGHPTGEAWTYTRGIVSQIRRDYAWENREEKIAHKATVIQTQTPINPGNSGGPLIDDKLAIIGINSFKSDGEGLNFAVSADDVKTFLAAKADRVSPKPRKNVAACKSKDIDQWREKDGKGDKFLVDMDCDGKGDLIVYVPDDEKEAEIWMLDTDGDGEVDAMIFDDKRDGKPDYALYDTDGNGKPDKMGMYRDGEDEPYRIEKIKEE